MSKVLDKFKEWVKATRYTPPIIEYQRGFNAGLEKAVIVLIHLTKEDQNESN